MNLSEDEEIYLDSVAFSLNKSMKSPYIKNILSFARRYEDPVAALRLLDRKIDAYNKASSRVVGKRQVVKNIVHVLEHGDKTLESLDTDLSKALYDEEFNVPKPAEKPQVIDGSMEEKPAEEPASEKPDYDIKEDPETGIRYIHY